MPIELTASDIEMIAMAVGCTKRQVRHVLKGARGERNTLLQQKIRNLAALRLQQNQNLQIQAANIAGIEKKSLAKAPEQRLYDIQNLLATQIIDNNQDGIFAFNERLQYILWNAQMQKITGVSTESCIGKTPAEIIDKISQIIDIERDTFFKNRVLAGETLALPAKPYVYPDGTKHWHELHIRPLHNNRGAIIGGIGTMRDVTSYVRIQSELNESVARCEIAEVFMSTIVCKGYMHGTHYIMEWVSPLFTAALGYTLEQFNMASRQNKGWIYNEAQMLRYKATEQQLLNKKVVKDFVMLNHRNGRQMPLACYYKPIAAQKISSAMQEKATFWLAINEVQVNKENDWQIRAFFDDAENFFAIIQAKTFEVIYANPSLIRQSKAKTVIGDSFVETHSRYYHRDIKQALFQLNKVFDRAYVILDLGATRAFDDRKLIWLFVQVNPTTIYAVGKMLL